MEIPLSRCQYDTTRPERIQPLQLAEGIEQHHSDETGKYAESGAFGLRDAVRILSSPWLWCSVASGRVR